MNANILYQNQNHLFLQLSVRGHAKISMICMINWTLKLRQTGALISSIATLNHAKAIKLMIMLMFWGHKLSNEGSKYLCDRDFNFLEMK